MKKNTWKQRKGFTMVEMLAVVAVIAIIVALVVPNGIFARTTGEEATAKAQAAAIELAMMNYLARGGLTARNTWALAPNNEARLNLLTAANNRVMPSSTSTAQIMAAFEGYNLYLPTTLGGSVRVARAQGDVQVYP